jgi:hypothetical protein
VHPCKIDVFARFRRTAHAGPSAGANGRTQDKTWMTGGYSLFDRLLIESFGVFPIPGLAASCVAFDVGPRSAHAEPPVSASSASPYRGTHPIPPLLGEPMTARQRPSSAARILPKQYEGPIRDASVLSTTQRVRRWRAVPVRRPKVANAVEDGQEKMKGIFGHLGHLRQWRRAQGSRVNTTFPR